jgi:hypothetical protein
MTCSLGVVKMRSAERKLDRTMATRGRHTDSFDIAGFNNSMKLMLFGKAVVMKT